MMMEWIYPLVTFHLHVSSSNIVLSLRVPVIFSQSVVRFTSRIACTQTRIHQGQGEYTYLQIGDAANRGRPLHVAIQTHSKMRTRVLGNINSIEKSSCIPRMRVSFTHIVQKVHLLLLLFARFEVFQDENGRKEKETHVLGHS